jgi:hypothetical protein
MSAAKILALPEKDFKVEFRKYLHKCPILHTKDYVGKAMACRTKDVLEERIAKRVDEQKEKEKELARSQQSTNQRAAQDATAQKQMQGKQFASISGASSSRRKPRISSIEFWNKLTSLLSRGNVSQTQATKVVQQFKILHAQYVARMSLEDIEDFASRPQ